MSTKDLESTGHDGRVLIVGLVCRFARPHSGRHVRDGIPAGAEISVMPDITDSCRTMWSRLDIADNHRDPVSQAVRPVHNAQLRHR